MGLFIGKGIDLINMDISKKPVILITGATSGIGFALARKLLINDYRVGLCGRSEQKMDALMKEITGVPQAQYEARIFDLLDEGARMQFIHDCEEKFQVIDVLINCAGANTARGKVVEIHQQDLEYMIHLNTIAPLRMMQEVAKGMQNRKSGLIINVLSSACLYSNENLGAYTASKMAFDALTKIARKELRQDRIRVCAIYPGGVNTTFRATPRPDYLSPESVADAIFDVIKSPPDVGVDEIVLRPLVETNLP